MDDSPLSTAQIREIVANAVDQLEVTNQRVLVLIPDGTRTMPLPLFFRLLVEYLRPKAREIAFLIALGTHPPMSETAILKLLGLTRAERTNDYGDVQIFNHAWQDPAALVSLGEIGADEIESITQGLFQQSVPVRLNRMVCEYDHLLICGPVFPHEVVGFSGGNKYFFPGIAGQEIIDFTHWLGALITSYEVIGKKDTPVRAVINRAAALIPRPRHALCCVVTHNGVVDVFFGAPEEAWARAAERSARVHIEWLEQSYVQVLSILPEMYDELWVGAKGMYKTEPIVADGGEVILYAPHLSELSRVHGQLIRHVGYHARDYFVKQWGQFRDLPWGVLAHSTHLRGTGTYQDGIERPRIQVTLATGIAKEVCLAVGLGYRDPASIDLAGWHTSQDRGILVVPNAGETLFRLRDGNELILDK